MVCLSGNGRLSPQSPFSRDVCGDVMLWCVGCGLVEESGFTILSSYGTCLSGMARGREKSRELRNSAPPGDTARAAILPILTTIDRWAVNWVVQMSGDGLKLDLKIRDGQIWKTTELNQPAGDQPVGHA